MKHHEFTATILQILEGQFGSSANDIFQASPLLQYLNIKTRSANRGSKARGSFANLYALFVLVEDYINHGFDGGGNYSEYQGAVFSALFHRQRELPFGSKLQNHSLNHRLNEEFKRYFPATGYDPILRDVATSRYWVNENLLLVTIEGRTYNLARAVLDIVTAYIKAKQEAFDSFIKTCEEMLGLRPDEPTRIIEFIHELLAPNVDARIFEIVSFAILKYYYRDQTVYFGFDLDTITSEQLALYKTGRTNANDGGIDFVMRPLGRFFQVTETLDVRKYFLDIDKIERFPITFVIKSAEPVENLRRSLEEGARKQYPVSAIIRRYMALIEEIINIPRLAEALDVAIKQGYIGDILHEIITQSKVEFNYLDVLDESESDTNEPDHPTSAR